MHTALCYTHDSAVAEWGQHPKLSTKHYGHPAVQFTSEGSSFVTFYFSADPRCAVELITQESWPMATEAAHPS